MNNLDKQYTGLLQDILNNGVKKQDRTGTGTLSVFGRTIRHKMSDGFPVITTKKLHFKSVVTELLWFLQGRTDLRYLLENDCHIWTGDTYKVYDKDFDRENPPFSSPYPKRLSKEEFEEKIMTNDEFNKCYGDLGPIYGKQWRSWTKPGVKRSKEGIPMGYKIDFIDQIQNSINLLKTEPDSRRNKVTSWNPTDLESSVLPPCHTDFQFYTRELSLEEKVDWLNKNYPMYDLGNWTIERLSDSDYLKDVEFEYNIPTRAISLMYNARSQDVPLGTPFNISSYALLLEIIGKMVNMIPDELIANMGDCHIYLNQIDGVKEQIGRELTIEERIDLASEKYENFDVMDFGIPFTCTHDNIDKYYPVPRNTREPFPLPSLKHLKTDDFYKSLSEDLSLLTHLDNTDFIIENYQSHPSIKIPLSN